MFKSAITDQFYAEDGSYATDANSTIEQFSTPLKKLPNSSINDFRNDLHLHPKDPLANISEISESISSQPSLRSQQYQLISSSTASIPAQSVAHGSLRPLSEIPAKLTSALGNPHADGLFSQKSESESRKNGAVFYEPLSIEGPILSKSFMPPPLQQTARNPLIVSGNTEPASYSPDLDIDDDLDDVSKAPTGEWTSPVVIQALRRQVNKERIFKSVWRNCLRLVFFHLSLLFAAYLYQLYQIRFHDENRPYRNDVWSQWEHLQVYRQVSELVISVSRFLHHLQWFFILKIVVGTARLLRPQDQCVDLPLTNKQRSLIGLKQIKSGEDDDDLQNELVIKERLFESSQHHPVKLPKYKKLTDFSGYVHRTPKPDQDEPSIALVDVLPTRRLVHSVPPHMNDAGVQQRRGGNFNF